MLKRQRMRGFAIAASLALAGCVPENLAVELPDPKDMRSMIVAIESEGRLALEAAHLVDGAPDRAVIRSFRDGARVTVLYYAESLDALGLPAASIEIKNETKRVRPLPRFTAAYSATAGDDTIGSWSALDALPAPLFDIRIATPSDACGTFEVVPVDLLPWAERAIAVSLEDGTALVGFTNDARLYRVYEDGHGEELEAPPNFHPLSAYRAADGVVWFSMEAKLVPWTEGQGFGTAFVEPGGAELGWIDGARGDAPFEIFTLTWIGEFFRFDGRSFERLAVDTTQGGPFLGAGQGLAWVAPGRAIAAVRDSGALFETRFGEGGAVDVMRTEWPVVPNGLHDTVAEVEGFGTIVPNNLGRFFAREQVDGVFDELPYGPFERSRGIGSINSLVAAPPRSFLFAGHYDFVVEYDREAGLCPETDLKLGLDVRKIIRIGESFLVVGAGRRVDDTNLTRVVTAILRRTRR